MYNKGLFKTCMKAKGKKTQRLKHITEHMYTCGGFILIFGKSNTVM